MQPTALSIDPAPHTARDVRWAVPFAGMLVSIALFPMIMPRVWHRRTAAVSPGSVLVRLVKKRPIASHHGVRMPRFFTFTS
jgi:hypothetical protein